MSVMTAVMSGVRVMAEAGFDEAWQELDDIKLFCVWRKSHLI